MPSGSKKRKAARKKKENQSVSTHSDGDDDVKQQDDKDSDKDSDVGELSSPTSHDHHNQNLWTEGEEKESAKGNIISNTPAEEASKNMDSEEPSTVVEDDSVVPVDREFDIEDKSSKKDDGSSYGSSSGSNSSRSSSDDEYKNSEAATDIAPVVDFGNGEKSLSGVQDENMVSAEIDNGVDSVVENFPDEELKNTATLGEKVEADTSVAPSIIEPVESDEKTLSLIEDNDISTVFMDVPSKRKDESIENIVTSDPKECVTQGSHERVAADIGVELDKDSGVTEVLLVPAPHPVQPTTWKSCCGLFEVFSGSGR